MSKTSARLIVRGLIELEVERAAAQAREYIPEADPDELDEWEPLTEADLQDMEPTEPFYTEQDLRDKAERKKARTPKAMRQE